MGGVEEEGEGEGDDQPPPHAEDESVLHSVGAHELGFSSALQGEGSNGVRNVEGTRQGGDAGASSTPSSTPASGAASSHPPQLMTALQRTVSTFSTLRIMH